ncbi:MAG: HTH domain-containing protein [Candidatus Zixiibacteriota bacterium]
MTLKKAEKLFELVSILRSGDGYHASELAEALDVSTRTIYRYVVDLSELVPIYYDKGYRIMPGSRGASLNLTRRELVAVKLALRTVELLGGSDYFTPAMRVALAKVESELESQLDEVDNP